jgi:hypothetical protein
MSDGCLSAGERVEFTEKKLARLQEAIRKAGNTGTLVQA